MPVPVRVLTYNVHGLRDDVAALSTLVRSLKPDAVMVQEAPWRLRWRFRCADLARRCGLLVASGGQPALGNLIMVSQRLQVRRAWSVRFSLRPGHHLRGAAFAHCRVVGAEFIVVGSHLSTDPTVRAEQAVQLRAAVEKLDGAVILGVDLNEPPGQPAYRELVTAMTDAGGDSQTPTFSATSPRRRIDMVFTAGPVRVRDYQVIDTPQARRASDHLPVLADLEV